MSEERDELREERLAAEDEAAQQERRQKLIKLTGAAVLAAVLILVIAIVASQSGSDDDSGKAAPHGLLDGIPQSGTVLGDPAATVTITEYGDLQCPICKEYASTVVPDVINGPVRAGDAKYEFKNWVIIGPQSITAAKASLAAAKQDRYFQFVESFYANQGTENSGYVTDQFLTKIAQDAGVPDIAQWQKDRAAVPTSELKAIDNEASNTLGFTGTPSFAVTDASGKTTPLGTVDAEKIKQAVAEAQQ